MIWDILTFLIVGFAAYVVWRHYRGKARKNTPGCGDQSMCERCKMCGNSFSEKHKTQT